MNKYPLFTRSDLSAFWALFADNLANMLVIAGVTRFVFNMPNEIVFGRILPGLGVAIIFGLVVYSYLARRLAEQENRSNVTALPYGISTPVMFVYLFGVIGPIYWATDDPLLAWQLGIAAGVMGGLLQLALSGLGPILKRMIPRAGMLGTLSGIALVFIATIAMARIYESPVIGFSALAIVMWGLIARYRLPFNMPAGLVALAVGTIIGLALGESSISFEGVGIYFPIPYFGDLMVGLNQLWAHPEVLAVIIPVQIYNFIETMNNVESAESVGDKYPVLTCQITDGLGTALGGLFGSPFPTTVYIGHPAYKRLGARAGYALAVGLVFFLGSIFGLVAFMGNLIPQAAVAPILVFVGVSIIGLSYNVVNPRHAIAVTVALIPHVSNLVVTKWGSVLGALGSIGVENLPGLTDAQFSEAMLAQGAYVLGQSALSSGAILTGMLWGAFVAYLIDGNFKAALYTTLAGVVLTGFGFIHAPSLHMFSFSEPIMWGYLIMGVIVSVGMFVETEQFQELDELELAEAADREAEASAAL
ncbi:MAG: xanthine/uracil/vitamin C permease [Anaerolineales bacterium]|nr:xanthine/uracil/vitamin C permease [Anaerolineales bacterium]